MLVPYDEFTGAFLSKITEYDLLQVDGADRDVIIDGYMKKAISRFQHICKVNLVTTADDENRQFDVDIADEDDIEEIVDIVSEGMVVCWMAPYLRRQEMLESVLNTRDYTTYSPAELLNRVGGAYKKAQDDFTNMAREYSFNHGDLTVLHL